MHLLIVEDDDQIATFLARGLAAIGHLVDTAGSGEAAIEAIAAHHYDAMVLDRMLPGLDGIEVLLRKPRDLPVLMLSALNTLDDRIEGLNAGADDYLVKPFEVAEVAARLNAIARRFPASERPDVLGAGDIEIVLTTLRATRDGKPLHLNKKEFALLAELVRNADRMVTRRMLIERVWGYSFDPSTNIIESNMSRLRGKLTIHGGTDPIETVRGTGYILRNAVPCPELG
ncbi:response regulator transcription factor [Novosphingobium resinovorum]|uniref:response regulator transcription factor n=1 Tax=Sphingomonadaceae TaxID=41297 RepID=UPI00027CA6D2|nr:MULTISPECIES: response regulator transcription factor [Sphingomonadaceae]EJU14028.1 two component transcriptional regulator [Sphingomonas sp. LH128]MBF7013406.1 response regulator transcription factor [Novosphingobium sp. HR1a]WJM25557.1 response regulator transcription factor [Novosphingobium resinovorum]